MTREVLHLRASASGGGPQCHATRRVLVLQWVPWAQKSKTVVVQLEGSLCELNWVLATFY
eukprot:6951954-Pyramimonas_sp.AAC.1